MTDATNDTEPDSFGLDIAPRDESVIGAGRPDRIKRPETKTAVLVVVAFVALLAAFLLGRASPPASDPVPDSAIGGQQPAPASIAASVAPQFATDLGGSGEIIAEIGFGDTRSALVLCRASGPSPDRLFISYLDTTVDPPALLAHNELLSRVECTDCSVDVAKLAGEVIGLGRCATLIQRGAFEERSPSSMVFVVAEPPPGIVSAVGFVVDCGITEIALDGGTLVLSGERPNPPPGGTRPNPPLRFERRGDRFEVDDLPLLRHYCNAAGSQQLFGFLPSFETWYAGRSELAYLETDSDIGRIGLRRQILVAINPQQCQTLLDVQSAWLAGAPNTLADITGLEPPEGTDNWFLVCQFG